MRAAVPLLAAVLLASTLGARDAMAGPTCAEARAQCYAQCSPDFVLRYYGGRERRCTVSCEPRFSACARTGWWADLERRRTGGWEKADGIFW